MARRAKKQTFEDALRRLEEVAEALEGGEMPLEEALKRYEEGVKAYRHCSSLLEDVERKIEILTASEEGKLSTEETEELSSEQ